MSAIFSVQRYLPTLSTIKLHVICNILLFSLMTSSAYCENFYSSIKRFSASDGLPDLTIYSMAKDKNGFLWLGTPSGLVRYDGYEFRRYSKDVNSLYPLAMSGAGQIFIDSKERYWVGSWGGGLALYSKEMKLLGKYNKNVLANSDTISSSTNSSSTRSKIQSSLKSNMVQTIFEDSDGDIWVGSNGGGLALFIPETNSFKSYLVDKTKADSISHNRIWSIVEQQPGILWIATSDGLNKFDKNTETFTRYYHDPSNSNSNSLTHSLVRALHVVHSQDKNNDIKSTLWVGMEKGLGIFDTQTEKFIDISPENTAIYAPINRIRQDKNNHLWIGTRNGLYQYDLNKRKFKMLANKNKSSDENNYRFFKSDNIKDIIFDSSGLLWLANYNGGLIKIDLKPVIFEKIDKYVAENGSRQTLNGVLAVYVDSENVLWLGTKEGLFYRDNETNFITRFKSSNKLSHLSFETINENKSGELWLGGPGGLHKIDQQRKTMTDQNKLLKKIMTKRVRTILFDNNENLWIGTKYSGIVMINGVDEKSTTIFTADDTVSGSLNSNEISSIYQDSFNRIWIGMDVGGLARLDRENNKFVKYVHQPKFKNSISDDAITTIYQTQDGDIWVGTKQTLNRYNPDNDSFEHFGVTDGLINSHIKSMFEDDFGVLWLSTNAGISQLDVSRKRFINYTLHHDLQEDRIFEGSVYKGQDGSLFFGGIGGLTKITPSQVMPNTHIPSVVITDVWVDNELSSQYMFDQEHPINLSFDIKNIKFRFAAIDLQQPDNNLHSYKLVGFDDHWSQASNFQTASYTNLDPGTYYFEVKGSNNSNLWNPEVSSVKLIINPPWWQRWWAYTIYILLLLSVVLIFFRLHRYKVLLERRLNLKLEQKVIERTVELEQQKLAVVVKNEEILATQQQLAQSEKMASLGTLTAGVAHEINNPTNYASVAVYMMKGEIITIKSFLKQLAGGDKADIEIIEAFDEKFAKLEDLTQTVSEGTSRIKTIVEDLRTFSRIGNVEESQVHISELILSTVKLVQTQYHDITITTQLDYDPWLTCYPSKLNQVFMNLIVNACQAVEDKLEQNFEQNLEQNLKPEPLEITSQKTKGQVTITSAQEGNNLVINFKDNGCGMNEATKTKIFDPFFTTKEPGKGTGLGLAISFGIIEDHKGTLEVNSVVGEGTMFCVCLPI